MSDEAPEATPQQPDHLWAVTGVATHPTQGTQVAAVVSVAPAAVDAYRRVELQLSRVFHPLAGWQLRIEPPTLVPDAVVITVATGLVRATAQAAFTPAAEAEPEKKEEG